MFFVCLSVCLFVYLFVCVCFFIARAEQVKENQHVCHCWGEDSCVIKILFFLLCCFLFSLFVYLFCCLFVFCLLVNCQGRTGRRESACLPSEIQNIKFKNLCRWETLILQIWQTFPAANNAFLSDQIANLAAAGRMSTSAFCGEGIQSI